MKKITGLFALFMLVLVLVTPGQAQDSIKRMHRFDLDGIEVIAINNPVGTIEVNYVEGNELSVEMELEGKKQGFFHRQRDVSDVDLVVSKAGDSLILAIEDDDVTAHWIINMPQVSLIDIDLGVGEIDVEILASSLLVDLGVGEVDVEALKSATAEIDVSTGVGDARIQGIDNIRQNRHIVTEKSEGSGEGEHPINIKVGVGSATVRLY